MKNYIKKHMTGKKRIYCLVMAVILTLSGAAGCGEKNSGSTIVPGSSILSVPTKAVTELETQKSTGEIQLTGVLTYLSTGEKIMHFVDIDSGIEYEVAYTGGTDIQNKYDMIITASNMQMGGIYDISCNSSGKAVTVYESDSAWEKKKITALDFNEENRKITIGNNTYMYQTYTAVLSNSNKISIAQIVAQDEVTLRGIGNTVYSINVDKGHGYIQFTGVDAFVGGYASIGTAQLFEVTSGMLTTTQEGTYKVELQLGSTVATKSVTVTRDESVSVDFSEYVAASTATQMGLVNFSVVPSSAVMTIDGVETDYSQPVSLSYGTHSIVLSAHNYEQYTETITVNQSYVTKVIDMVSTSSTTAATTTTAKTTKASTTNTATTPADLTDGYTVSITEPEGAALYVDSVYIGLIPCSFDKNSGNKTITLTKSGCETVSYTIAIANTAGNLTYAFPDMQETSE